MVRCAVVFVAAHIFGASASRMDAQQSASAATTGSWLDEDPTGPSAVVKADSLNAEIFTGASAWTDMCTFWSKSTPSHTYRKKGCMNDCATLKIDCNTGEDDGIIKLTYARHSKKVFGKETVYSIYKKHKAHQSGRFLLFRTVNDEPVQEGCLEWMQDSVSWCEGPKWSKKEDDDGVVTTVDLSNGAKWELVYNWLSYEGSERVWRLEEDVMKGERQKDEPLVAGLKSTEEYLGPNIGTVGPAVPTTYLTGATNFDPNCFANDKPVGTDLPIAEDKTCEISLWKSNPKTGMIVKSTWVTTHMPTELKKEFAS